MSNNFKMNIHRKPSWETGNIYEGTGEITFGLIWQIFKYVNLIGLYKIPVNLKLLIYSPWFLTEEGEIGFLDCFKMALTYNSDPHSLMT